VTYFSSYAEPAMEVVAELDAGQVFPVTGDDGTTELVEVYRADMPWSRPPPTGFAWTPDDRMAEIVDRAPPLPDSVNDSAR
jgi:hypothetical protein